MMEDTYLFFSCGEHEPGTVETMFKASGTMEDLFARRYELVDADGYLNKHGLFVRWHIAQWDGEKFIILQEALIEAIRSKDIIYERFVTPDKDYAYRFTDLDRVKAWDRLQAYEIDE